MMRLVTHLGGARVTIGVSLLLAASGGDAARAGRVALLANVLSHLLVQILKRTVQRPRPADPYGNPTALVSLPDPYSFPSGHSAAAFAVATPVALVFPFASAPVLAVAALVAASRVKLKVHYTSDVVAGTALGLLGAAAAWHLVS